MSLWRPLRTEQRDPRVLSRDQRFDLSFSMNASCAQGGDCFFIS